MPEPAIVHLFLSPGHNYFGHHGGPAGEHPVLSVPEIECLAGRGLRGDRFLDFKPDYKGQITFFAWEDLVRMWSDLDIPEASRKPAACRRNVITQGWDPALEIGREFTIQGVRFLGTEECRPCYWMKFRHPLRRRELDERPRRPAGQNSQRRKIAGVSAVTILGSIFQQEVASALPQLLQNCRQLRQSENGVMRLDGILLFRAGDFYPDR